MVLSVRIDDLTHNSSVIFCFLLLSLLFFCAVVFSYLVCLFYFILLFHFILLYFLFVCFLVSLYVSYEFPCLFSCFGCFFKLLLVGRRGLYLVPFVFFFFWLFFSRGKGYFNSLVVRVRNSSSAGQSMTYISVLGAYSSFTGRLVD